MKPLYIIPARGGSKGIPGKNLRRVGGVSLIGHSIRHALAAGADKQDICVSTDSEQIRQAAVAEGIEVPFLRPAGLASDTASSRSVMIHALDWHAAHGRVYDTVVLLQPTSPLRAAADITGAIELFRSTPGTDMVVGVTEARANPYYSAFEPDGSGWLHICKGPGGITRRQDAPKVWEFNGAIYVIDADALRRAELSAMKHILPWPMPAERSFDIDSPIDLLIADHLLQNHKI